MAWRVALLVLGLVLMPLVATAQAAGFPSMYASRGSSMSHDYKDSLTKSIVFFEGQRSGKLPPNQRMRWRGDSALKHGASQRDELLWGAAWLRRATGNAPYLNYIQSNGQTLGAEDNVDIFSWDKKHAGSRVLLAQKGDSGPNCRAHVKNPRCSPPPPS